MPQEYKMREIAQLDLANFKRPDVPDNRSFLWRAAWYTVNALFFDSKLLALVPSRLKASILRVFGAQVGRGFVCKPRVSIKYPWFLEVGDHVWLGESVWIDNLCLVRIGSNVCVSQGAKIFTGNHDWSDASFPFFCKPVQIGDGAWITAFRVIRPGTVIPAHVAVLSD